MIDLPASAKLYLRPVHFTDTPVGMDGQAARLAGGLNWFTAYALIVVAEGRRIAQHIVPVGALPDDPRLQLLAERISAPRKPLTLGDRVIRMDEPQVMGILNVTPDSFSDAGKHIVDPAGAAQDGIDMCAAGAAIIDVGGESTRPGAEPLWEGDEINRVIPPIERLARAGTAISIDTRRAAVMEAALSAGAHLINDVAALLYDPRALEVAVASGAPVALMHSPEPEKGPHGGDGYSDVLLNVYDWLEERVEAVVAAGIARDKIVIDPGIGFGKSLQDNLTLLNGLALFHGLGCPILLGASRKRMIGALSNEAPADARLGGSVAIALKGAELGAQIIRVHDVFETVQALRVWRGMRDAALTARP